MHLVYIHGAKSTPNSFNFIRSKITGFNETLISYRSSTGFVNNVKQMKEKLKDIDEPIFFIGHSLGGLYALHLKDVLKEKVAGAITLSTPYNGSNVAHILKYFSILKPQQLFIDITPYSYPVIKGNEIVIDVPWTNIVTTTGHNDLMGEINDGVVSKRSMTHRAQDMKLVEVDTNHYEVLQYPEVIELVKKEIEKCLTQIKTA